MPDEEVRPTVTDSNIQTFDNPHGIYFPSEQRLRNQLLLFIPGTQPSERKGEPQKPGANWFCKVAALNGYHVVYLMYPNDIAAMEACPHSPDRDAFSAFRWALIEGGNTPYINVPRAESIENRTIKLMEYLQHQHPAQNWGQFVVGDHIAWQKVAVAGQSQGGGHAANLALVTPKVNRMKGARPPQEFLREVKQMKSFGPRPSRERTIINKRRKRAFFTYMPKHCSENEEDWF